MAMDARGGDARGESVVERLEFPERWVEWFDE